MMERTLGELLRLAAQREPHATAFVHGERQLSYAEWDELADRLAARLAAAGIRRGAVLALLLPSVPLYLIAYLAAARLGVATTGINTRYRSGEIGHILRHSGAAMLIAVTRSHDADFSAALVELRPTLPELGEVIWLAPDDLERGTAEIVTDLSAGLPPAPPVAVEVTDPAAIVFTSGTTGTPKGACYSHAALSALASIETQRYPGGQPPYRHHLAAGLSFAHVGTMARIAFQLQHCLTSILHSSFDPAAVLATVERERLVHIGGIPTQLLMLLDHPDFARRDLSSLRSVLIGGAPAPAELIRRLLSQLEVSVSVRYSSTEVGIATASLPGDSVERLTTTVGKATPGVELHIVDGANHPMTAGELGEVVVRSAATMSGYWRAPELTVKAIDGEGWVHTGDLGFLDSENYLHLQGRQSDMYIRAGYNVVPEEVEALLARHPKVAQVAVVGAADAIFGEIGVAFIVARDPKDPPSLAELRAWVGERLASFKRPDELELIERLPLTPMFKVDKRALRARLSSSSQR
ncbi:MAG TPA: class I adenylate-forming enzyme family protein [Terriglobales bacterium]|nr:class I adenylate-forming enzyme family protein [Terriglobales bacterium]